MKPFLVRSRIAGRFFLLHWWTYNERGHIVLARRPASILAAFERILEDHPDAEVRAYMKVKVVGPSNRLCVLGERADRNKEVMRFRCEVWSQLYEARKRGLELPKQFTTCELYEPDPDDEHTEWARERHFGCRNCHDTIRLEGMTLDELYDQHIVGWRKIHPDYPHDDRRVESPAPPAGDDEPFWYARANLGNHSGGIELKEVDFETAEYFPPEDVLFFFRPFASLDTAWFNELLKIAQKSHEEESERMEAVRLELREEEEKREAEQTVAFFRGKVTP